MEHCSGPHGTDKPEADKGQRSVIDQPSPVGAKSCITSGDSSFEAGPSEDVDSLSFARLRSPDTSGQTSLGICRSIACDQPPHAFKPPCRSGQPAVSREASAGVEGAQRWRGGWQAVPARGRQQAAA